MSHDPAGPLAPLRHPARVVLTAGLGALGASLAAALLSACPAAQLVLLDPAAAAPPPGRAALCAHPRVRAVPGVADDPAALASALAEGVDALVHLEGLDGGEAPGASPLGALEARALGAQRLLERARRAGDPLVLLAVPATVYGPRPPGAGPLSASAPLSPETAEAVAWAAGALLARAARLQGGQPALVAALDAPVGPGQGPSAPVSAWIAAAWARRPLVAGPGLRGWLAIDDLAAGLCAALLRAPLGAVVQLGAPDRRADRDVAAAVLEILGRPAALLQPPGPAEGADLGAPLLDPGWAARLDWRPVRRFDDALAEAVEWAIARRRA